MSFRRFYAHHVGGFYFRIYRVSHGWRAKVLMPNKRWLNVGYPLSGFLVRETKRELISYLNYAYGGEP